MLNLRKILAIAVGKLIIDISRAVGNQGSNLPGRLAGKIYPALLADLSRNTVRDTFIITGTNGKTTTTNMIAAIFRENGSDYVHNQAGANMIDGITTAFLGYTNWKGTRGQEYALLEADEANVPLLLNLLRPRFILITNFFRDQLDRYGELDQIIKLITNAVKGRDIELILNADDPLESHFAQLTGLHCWYYGFTDTAYDRSESSESREGRYCVLCGHELEYRRYHYAQLGTFQCPQCGHHNPAADFEGYGLHLNNGIRFQVNALRIESPYQGFYNAYNTLAAVSLTSLAGIDIPVIQRALAHHQPSAGRMETFQVKGKRVVLILVKNPTGFDQSLVMLAQDGEDKNLFIALNDNAADGRDISWIWDAEVEILATAQQQIKLVVCSGQRSGDMALRIKYAGLETNKIALQSSLRDGIEQAVNLESKVSYVLCTYTALFTCRKLLLKMKDPRV
jgi:lipid II isoglutaminyl synthase (glutamine-hydrolysing)